MLLFVWIFFVSFYKDSLFKSPFITLLMYAEDQSCMYGFTFTKYTNTLNLQKRSYFQAFPQSEML